MAHAYRSSYCHVWYWIFIMMWAKPNKTVPIYRLGILSSDYPVKEDQAPVNANQLVKNSEALVTTDRNMANIKQ